MENPQASLGPVAPARRRRLHASAHHGAGSVPPEILWSVVANQVRRAPHGSPPRKIAEGDLDVLLRGFGRSHLSEATNLHGARPGVKDDNESHRDVVNFFQPWWITDKQKSNI